MLDILSKQDQLWRIYALKICGCPTNADDLVQDMYIKLSNHKGDISNVFIYRTLRSIFIDDCRRKKIQTVELDKNISKIEDEDKLEQRLELLEIIKDLDFFHREVLLITHETSLRKAAKEINVPHYVLNYYKKKGLKKLKDANRRAS